MSTSRLYTAAALALCALVVSCRGGISTKPPLHVVPDMDWQPKLKAQSRSKFMGWEDQRGMRPPVIGTVARGSFEGAALAVNKIAGSGDYVTTNPLPLTKASLAQGQKMFSITCTPCHGASGRGGNKDGAYGTVGKLWPVAIPSFIHDERVSKIPDGEIFEVITNGKGTMPAYAHQVPVEDRWAIIQYIRALQLQAAN